MKRLSLILMILLAAGCKSSDSGSSTPTATATVTGDPYTALYGIPDQNLITPCTGDKSLVRPIVKCTKRANNEDVTIALCYHLDPVYMTIPSPAGQKSTPITGGQKLETCAEGSTLVTATSLLCSAGFKLSASASFCQSYESTGSYLTQTMQSHHAAGGLKILYNFGSDHLPQQTKDGLKLILVFE